jgi:hypothetical protein
LFSGRRHDARIAPVVEYLHLQVGRHDVHGVEHHGAHEDWDRKIKSALHRERADAQDE